MLLDNERLRKMAGGLPRPLKRAVKQRLFRTYLRPTDVFLVGHPKSGNTWLAYLLAIILKAGDPEGRVTVANLGESIPGIHGRDLDILKYRTLPDPRVFRQEFPEFPDRYPRTLYVVRDPRSVLVSYYHHYRVTTGDEMGLDTFVTKYLADGSILTWEPLVRWDRQVQGWMQRAREDASVMVVKYEALHDDRRSTLEDVAGFCRMPSSDEAIARAVERSTFDAMRSEEEQSGAEAYLLDGGTEYRERRGQRGWFFRQGRVDGWKEELPPNTRRAIETEFRPVMQALGYPFLN